MEFYHYIFFYLAGKVYSTLPFQSTTYKSYNIHMHVNYSTVKNAGLEKCNQIWATC